MTDNTSKNISAIVIMFLLTALVVSDPAYAAAPNNLGNIDTVLRNIVEMMTGTTARLIAIICVSAVGLGWMSGFIDLRKTAYCILGVGIVFGAPSLVTKLVGAPS